MSKTTRTEKKPIEQYDHKGKAAKDIDETDPRKVGMTFLKAYRGTILLPFEAGRNRRIAVKIVDDRGIESLKIGEVK